MASDWDNFWNGVGNTWDTVTKGIGDAWSTVSGQKQHLETINKASDAQTQSAQAGIDLQNEQFKKIQELLAPFVNAGAGAISQQQALLGLSGQDAQNQAIQGIQASPQFQAMTQQGENAILQNASATGGLRGGNTQTSLAQFRPQLLSQLINQQYQNLGGLSGLGQASAAGVGAAGQGYAQNASNLLQQQGAAQAGGILSQQKLLDETSPLNVAIKGLGIYTGLGGKIF